MLIKTEKGRQELRPGQRTLGQRERAVLLLADGQHSESHMSEWLGSTALPLMERLMNDGFLERVGPVEPVPSPASPPPPDAPSHGDPFIGTRSLATARMYLFDLSERLFAPRDPALAAHFRQALRDAPDAPAMLAVGRDMIARVEQMAGSERADGISERLAKLLPADMLGAMA